MKDTNFDKRKTVDFVQEDRNGQNDSSGFRSLMNALSEIIVKQNL